MRQSEMTCLILTLNEVANLIQGNWLRFTHKRHSVLEIKVSFSIRAKLLVDRLRDT